MGATYYDDVANQILHKRVYFWWFVLYGVYTLITYNNQCKDTNNHCKYTNNINKQQQLIQLMEKM